MPTNNLATRKPFAPSPQADGIIASAVTAVKGIVAMPILEEHQRELIDVMIWMITEAHGMWNMRYRSERVLTDLACKIERDHVYTRKYLTEAILLHPERCEEILDDAIACLVTEEEHQSLGRVSREYPHLKGWERYRQADIAVRDMAEATNGAS